MKSRATLAAALASSLLAACGGGETGGGDEGGGNSGPGTDPNPPASDCQALARVDMSGAVEVASDEALRTALAAGGKISLTADIQASGPFDVGPDTVLDGGGHTVSGGGTTHLFVARMVDFTIQNANLVDGNNQVSDDEHFARRSGAAIMASGGNGTSGLAKTAGGALLGLALGLGGVSTLAMLIPDTPPAPPPAASPAAAPEDAGARVRIFWGEQEIMPGSGGASADISLGD